MNPEQLRDFAVEQLEENKAQDIVVIAIPESNIADYMIICSGTSSRHVMAMGDHLVAASKKEGSKPLGVEEDPTGTWTLVDLDDVIVHIMLPQTREFYNLEQLWGVELAEKNRNK